MNYNFKIIYVSNNAYLYFYEYIVRVLVPIKDYFYHLFVFCSIEIYQYLPLQPYLNNTGFKL